MFEVAPPAFCRACVLILIAFAGNGLSEGELEAQPGAAPPRNVEASPLTAFYPAPSPVLGDPIPRRKKAVPGETSQGELTAFLNEPFYTALNICLTEKTLAPEIRREVEAYRSAKSSLQTELIARLYTLRESEPAPRLHTLEEFAHFQALRLAELEEQEERIRKALATTAENSERFRDWKARIPESSPQDSRSIEYERTSVALAFEEGFSPTQRRLLGEIGLEARTEADPVVMFAGQAKAEQAIFFSPEMARVRIPVGLPAETTAMLTAYSAEKKSLKDELRRISNDHGAGPDGLGREARQALAEKQASRIEKLDTLAERIRRALAGPSGRFNFEGLSLPPLPPDLERQIATYRKEKIALQKELLARVEMISPARETSAGGEEKGRQIIAAFTQENAARYAALDREREAVRGAIAKLASTGAVVVKGPYADALSQRFTEALQQIDVWRNYRDYQTAVFEPGLSPGQRRILFDFAIEKLALPLPNAETPRGR